MKTEYIDSEIERLTAYEKTNDLSNYGQKILNELRSVKKQLTLTDVGSSYFTSADIGKEFEIVKNDSNHGFEIGETVILDSVSLADDDAYKFIGKKDYYWCGFTDVKML